ncbi:NADP-dependent oxidoreductase domain-containing protein 1 [Carcharodon carcharias]|uniref:NADP-dependent oxidoreductase domain-containing protein 1 n=1 Tax=Carcharodon carcharias TaxID=13397 RepID=UPI001B7EA715|nr:NADP-dependent oxidoreductase domain-containing protein 1 [Carcharodon carcharias]
MAAGDYLSLIHRLPSLGFEAPLTEEEKTFTETVRIRAWGLTVCGCAHAAFYCRLLTATRCKILDKAFFCHSWLAKYEILKSIGGSLKIGVLGCGHFGKQLVLSLLQLTDLNAACITVSTRRPEKLNDLTDLGIKCIYDNKRLATSVDVMFLCCLPSHLPAVSSQIRGCISKSCIVYSFVTAVPVARLKNLLAHSTIVRPHYFIHRSGTWSKLWGTGKSPVEALQTQEVIEVTSPFKEDSSEFTPDPHSLSCVDLKWFEEVLYSVLNFCYLLKVPHNFSLDMLNDLLFSPSHGVEALDSPTLFVCESFVNASCVQSLTHSSPFPWFDLSSVSMRDTPLTRFFVLHPRLKHHLSFTYRMSMLKKSPSDLDDCCRH